MAEATRASRCAGVRAWHPNERTYQTITALAPIHNNKYLRTCSMNNSIQITTPAYKQRHGVLYPHHSQGISTPGIVLAPGVRCQGRSSTRIRRKGRMDSPFQCTAGGCPVVTFVQCRAAHGARHNMRTKDACQCHPLRLAQLLPGRLWRPAIRHRIREGHRNRLVGLRLRQKQVPGRLHRNCSIQRMDGNRHGLLARRGRTSH